MDPSVRISGVVTFVCFPISITDSIAGIWYANQLPLKQGPSGTLELTMVTRCFISSNYAVARLGIIYVPVCNLWLIVLKD